MVPVSWSERDGSEAVARFWPLYEKTARRFTGARGAEYDDLVQEAAIAGWLAINAGWIPTTLVCERACMRWCRSLNTGGQRLVSESW